MKTDKPDKPVIARKIALILDKETEAFLDSQSRICNRLWNDLIQVTKDLTPKYIRAKQERNEFKAKKIADVLYKKRGLRDLVPEHKKIYPFFKQVYSSVLKNTALRVEKAMAAYQNGKHSGRKVRQPRYRSFKKKFFSLEYDNTGWKIKGNQLDVSFGKDKNNKQIHKILTLSNPPDLTGADTMRITKEYGVFYAIFTTPFVANNKKQIDNVIYIDPNIKNTGVSCDSNDLSIEFGGIYDSIIKKLNKRIDKIQSKRDRKDKKKTKVIDGINGVFRSYYVPSKAWTRLDNALKKAEHLKREIIKQFLFTYAHYLCKNYNAIGLGNYVVPNGKTKFKKMNRKMRGNTYHGKFQPILKHVANRAGATVFIIDEKGTTRTCSECGHVEQNGIHPSIREWVCPCCSFVHRRDENSAKIGLLRTYVSCGNLFVPRLGPAVKKRCNATYLKDGRWEMSVPTRADGLLQLNESHSRDEPLDSNEDNCAELQVKF